jgi:hypothetical protein
MDHSNALIGGSRKRRTVSPSIAAARLVNCAVEDACGKRAIRLAAPQRCFVPATIRSTESE